MGSIIKSLLTASLLFCSNPGSYKPVAETVAPKAADTVTCAVTNVAERVAENVATKAEKIGAKTAEAAKVDTKTLAEAYVAGLPNFNRKISKDSTVSVKSINSDTLRAPDGKWGGLPISYWTNPAIRQYEIRFKSLNGGQEYVILLISRNKIYNKNDRSISDVVLVTDDYIAHGFDSSNPTNMSNEKAQPFLAMAFRPHCNEKSCIGALLGESVEYNPSTNRRSTYLEEVALPDEVADVLLNAMAGKSGFKTTKTFLPKDDIWGGEVGDMSFMEKRGDWQLRGIPKAEQY